MADARAELSGSQCAAIFLLGVGEEGAAAIMKHMAPKEVQRVGEAMAGLQDVSNEQIASVVQDFSDKVSSVSPIGIGASDFTRRVMVEALGEKRARSMLNKVMQGNTTKGMDALKWMDARSVAGMINSEHPQIIALVLASLDGEHAAQVLPLLPNEIRADVILRIARLELIDPSALRELDQVLEKQLGDSQEFPPASVDGMNTAASILNHLDTSDEMALLASVSQVDGDLGEKIQDLMFVFDNLLSIDDRGMQRLIREISGDSLVIALKGVDEQVKNKFFKNMSSRAAEMLKEDLEAKGPVKLSDVEAQQKEILGIATQLAEDGEIFLGKGGGDFV
ncbi:MAG: flagellar motor switch protein FliG [Gammaproteobacteria bacterium]|nr:MAG: flagellar motor switch protein FliG [Gammaproteobacteria bacterium]HDY83917.1 flagellar motor switch protein FliG [Halieaceae bacterium]